MEFNIKLGEELIKEILVTEEMSAMKIGSGTIDVFSTPSMIALMESVSKDLLQSFLEEEYSSVGINVNINHVKGTKIGSKVTCIVKIIEIDGKKITFSVEAKDEKGKIGEGTHKRYIINKEEFLKRL